MEITNVVLTACAGSGKTHQLIQRMLLLLKNGAAPGEILAITFTKKAAAEIKTRLLSALEETDEEWARRCLRRILLADTMADTLSIHTFHSWFGLLLAGRHWTPGWYGPGQLVENDAEIKEQAWLRWLKKTEREDDAAYSKALTTVLHHCSPESLKKTLVEELTGQLNVWRLFNDDSAPPNAATDDDTEALKEKLDDALRRFVEEAPGTNLSFNKALAAAERFLADGDVESLRGGFLTKQETINANLAKNAKDKGYEYLLTLCVTALNDMLNMPETHEATAFHAAMTVLAQTYLQTLEEVKRADNLMTFDDLEYQAYQAIRRDGDINAMLYRINLRFKHLLIDEFQDTNPIQWQIIRLWLHAAHGSDDSPSVFIVGDDKQAIYGFRHGDARLLGQAKEFLHAYYAAELMENPVCRRCAPPVLEWVNHTFNDRIDGFIKHRCDAANARLPGRTEWHPPPPTDNTPKAKKRVNPSPRNPLKQSRQENKDKQQQKAAALVNRVREIIGKWQILGDDGKPRLCREEDILILMPQKTHLATLTAELSRRALSFSVRGGGISFLHSFACADVLALTRVLLDAENSLSLATVLKSPIFAFNEDLFADVACSGNESASLWEKLNQHNNEDARHAAAVLRRWRQWAQEGILPTHDLLSKIFKDGDIIARYRGAVIPPMRQSVGDNLLALLDFSLCNDGGRQPLIGQFFTQVETALRNNPPPIPGDGGIRLSTIHQAKGLEAPVVILADTTFDKPYSKGQSTSVKLFVDWPSDSAVPRAAWFRPSTLKRAFADLAAQQQQKDEREYENLLYVAMTRAQQALLVFCTKDDKNPRLTALKREKRYTGTLPTAPTATVTETAKKEKTVNALPPIGVRQSTAETNAAKAGEELHHLAALAVAGLTDSQILAVAAPQNPALLPQVRKMLSAVQPLAEDEAQWLAETEFIENGTIRRTDLLIVNRNTVWVIDYKSGGHLARYRGQLQEYRRLVATTHPDKTVRAALLTPDGTLIPENSLAAEGEA